MIRLRRAYVFTLEYHESVMSPEMWKQIVKDIRRNPKRVFEVDASGIDVSDQDCCTPVEVEEYDVEP